MGGAVLEGMVVQVHAAGRRFFKPLFETMVHSRANPSSVLLHYWGWKDVVLDVKRIKLKRMMSSPPQ